MRQLCHELAASYAGERRGFQLVEVADGWRYPDPPRSAPIVERYVLEGQSARLSTAALETLAIVAYKQPISRAQVSAIRGVNVDGVLRTLVQRGYVGRGRPRRGLRAGRAVRHHTDLSRTARSGVDRPASARSAICSRRPRCRGTRADVCVSIVRLRPDEAARGLDRHRNRHRSGPVIDACSTTSRAFDRPEAALATALRPRIRARSDADEGTGAARREPAPKVLARIGVGSRRVCEDLIFDERVTVNGDVAVLGRRVTSGVDVSRSMAAVLSTMPDAVTYLLNKPAGMITTAIVIRKVGRPSSIWCPMSPECSRRSPRRRDRGLAPPHHDGALAHRLTHPSFGVEKEYLAARRGQPEPAACCALREGVELDDGPTARRRSRPSEQGLVRIIIHEGRNRQVRRMCEAVGHPVHRLVRTRIGPRPTRRSSPGRGAADSPTTSCSSSSEPSPSMSRAATRWRRQRSSDSPRRPIASRRCCLTLPGRAGPIVPRRAWRDNHRRRHRRTRSGDSHHTTPRDALRAKRSATRRIVSVLFTATPDIRVSRRRWRPERSV